MSSVLWSFMNCLAVVFVKEDFLSTFLKRKKNRWIFICVWMFYFLFHFMTKVENYIINLIQDATVTVIVCWLGYDFGVVGGYRSIVRRNHSCIAHKYKRKH